MRFCQPHSFDETFVEVGQSTSKLCTCSIHLYIETMRCCCKTNIQIIGSGIDRYDLVKKTRVNKAQVLTTVLDSHFYDAVCGQRYELIFETCASTKTSSS